MHDRPRCSSGAEEPGPKIIIDSDYLPAFRAERPRTLGADEATRTSDKSFHLKMVGGRAKNSPGKTLWAEPIHVAWEEGSLADIR